MNPRDWERVRLNKYCLKIGSGSTPRGGEQVYQSEGTALIRSQNIYNGVFSSEGLAFISDEEADRLNGVTVVKNDILLNITGDSVARCCQVPENILPARVNQHVAIVRPRPDEFDTHFLKYFLISPWMQSMMLSLAGSGGTRKALTKEMIQNFEVPKPPLQLQEKIASILSSYDNLIENNRRRMAILEEAARLLYEEWFVHLRFPGHEYTQIIDGIPKGWEQVPLGERITLNYGKSLKSDTRVEGTFPVYGSSGNVGSHEKALVKGPGIILGRKGNVGSVFWSNKDFYPIDTVYYVDEETSNFYLFHALKHMHFINTDVAVPGLNRDFAYSRPLLFPSKNILRQFLEMITPLHEQIDKLKETSEKLRAARNLLLPRLMSGEIAV